jgi:hypothetical protein
MLNPGTKNRIGAEAFPLVQPGGNGAKAARAAGRWPDLQAYSLAAGIVVLFVILQAATLTYGTRINDLPFIRDYRVTTDVVSNSGLNRDHLVGSTTSQSESVDVWMVRFKLYPIEADEVDNIIALARIKPGLMQFDPKFYQYGGAFLYPLGGWYLSLSKLGALHLMPLGELLRYPQQIDGVWIGGRAFVLLAFAISAFLLFMTLNELAPTGIAAAGLAIYLLCPASIMFSQVTKPHWYALLWVNTAFLIVTRAFIRNRLTLMPEIVLSVAIGLAVGSAATFGLMAVFIWIALAILARRGGMGAVSLLRIPLVAGAAFLLSNPYYVLNWPAVQAERAATANWFSPSIRPDTFLMFVQNSLFSGFGIAVTALIFAVVIWHLLRGPGWARLFSTAIVIAIGVTAVMTASMSTWTVNFRYIPYVLPAALILIALRPWPYRGAALVLCLVATVAQSAPLKLAYFDENSTTHSTRLLAAEWIDANIPKQDAICLATNTLVPFDVPPFRFDQYKLNSPDCRWRVEVERHLRAVAPNPREEIAKRFVPRLSPQFFPLVWEHINPQITIYRNNG